MAMGSPGSADAPIAEINITPLTDVMLVLLIIAMVIAPTLAIQGAPLNLPKVEQPQEFDLEDNLLQITADGSLFFNQEPIDAERLGQAFAALTEAAGNDVVTLIIAADPAVAYQQVLDMWNLATENKIERIVLAGDVVDQYGRSLLRTGDEAPGGDAAPPAPPEDAGG